MAKHSKKHLKNPLIAAIAKRLSEKKHSEKKHKGSKKGSKKNRSHKRKVVKKH